MPSRMSIKESAIHIVPTPLILKKTKPDTKSAENTHKTFDNLASLAHINAAINKTPSNIGVPRDGFVKATIGRSSSVKATGSITLRVNEGIRNVRFFVGLVVGLFVMVILLSLVIIIIACLFMYFIMRSSQRELLTVIKSIQESSQNDKTVLLDNLHKSGLILHARLDHATQSMGDLLKHVGEMTEIGRGMKDLQSYLFSPKLRGTLGEHVLRDLLSQVLPKGSFTLQYTFKTGDKVDAIVTTAAGIIPIDSKFPMENFRKFAEAPDDLERGAAQKSFERDMKSHIDRISKKYILPSEGTLDYALMYIPSEAVYYEIVNHGALYEYALKSRVLPTSPTTFYAYIRAILMGLEGQKIEAQAKHIMATMRSIEREYVQVSENMGTLHKHLTHAVNSLSLVDRGIRNLGSRISSTKLIHDDTPVIE